MIAKTKIKKKKINKNPKFKSGHGKPKINFNNKQGSKKKLKQPIKNMKPIQNIQDSEQESDQGEDLLDMVEKSDLDYLRNAVANRSYSILNKIRYSEDIGPKRKRQKMNESDEELEEEYKKITLNQPKSNKRALLPIKTKSGVIPQSVETIEDDEEPDATEDDDKADNEEKDENKTNLLNITEPISTVQLLASRNQILQQRKIDIGILSASFLENSEEKISNLKILLNMLDEEIPEIHYTVRKLVIMSLLEIFKDVLPSYEIKHVRQEGVKFKKDTLKLYKYEEGLLLYYKKYLQKLEKFGYRVIRKKGQSKRLSEEETNISVLSIQALCELLVTHPYFNYSENIAQALVPLMNNRIRKVREIITNSFKNVFKDDKKGEITLKVLRLINNFIKLHSNNVHTEMLEVLLVLNLKGVSLDQEKVIDKKQKKLQAHKSRILQLSKKERKRVKKLKEVEKELIETKAEENKDTKTKNLTEITKMIFNIYFRVLKNTENTKLLGACFEGLAKFVHYINLEYSLDIITALDKILNEDWLNPNERLHCMQTVFAILSGQGEALNVDPSGFYNRLYKDLLTFTLSTKNDETLFDLVKTLDTALVKRRKKITNKRTIGFVKRIATLCLQLLHDGSIGCLAIVKTLIVLNRFVDILLDTDTSVGEGKFLPDVDDPEYCNASNTALYEMTLLVKHYHPVVITFANHIVNISAPNGHKTLSGIYAKMSPDQLYTEFNMSEMVFNPVVPIPKVTEPKTKLRRQFADDEFYNDCKRILNRGPQNKPSKEVVI